MNKKPGVAQDARPGAAGGRSLAEFIERPQAGANRRGTSIRADQRRAAMTELYGSDAYAPLEVAGRVANVGVAKAHMATLAAADAGRAGGRLHRAGLDVVRHRQVRCPLGFAAAQIGGGLVFSLGLLLVVVAGAELFTGNNLLAMAWADGKITSGELLRNWLLVCAANFVGAAGLALVVFLSGHTGMNEGASGARSSGSPRPSRRCRRRKPSFAESCATCWSAWRCGWPWRAAASWTRRWPSSFRSAPSWRPVSSTASPTCT